MKDIVNTREAVVFRGMKLKAWIQKQVVVDEDGEVVKDKHGKPRRLPQTVVAARIGMTDGHLSMLIAGKRMPSLSTLDRIDRVTEGKVTWKDWAGRR